MEVNQDFAEFFDLLSSHNVRFLVIGGAAYNHHAPPRATKDIDVWVEPTPDNLAGLLGAITAFGFPTEGLEVAELTAERRVLMLGRVPYRIDILTQPSGVEWARAWERRVAGRYGDVPIALIGLDDLILAKRAAGRPRDLADLAVLEDIRSRRAQGS